MGELHNMNSYGPPLTPQIVEGSSSVALVPMSAANYSNRPVNAPQWPTAGISRTAGPPSIPDFRVCGFRRIVGVSNNGRDASGLPRTHIARHTKPE